MFQKCSDQSKKWKVVADVQNWKHEVFSSHPGPGQSSAGAQGKLWYIFGIITSWSEEIFANIWNIQSTSDQIVRFQQVVTDEGENIYFYQQELKVNWRLLMTQVTL